MPSWSTPAPSSCPRRWPSSAAPRTSTPWWSRRCRASPRRRPAPPPAAAPPSTMRCSRIGAASTSRLRRWRRWATAPSRPRATTSPARCWRWGAWVSASPWRAAPRRCNPEGAVPAEPVPVPDDWRPALKRRSTSAPALADALMRGLAPGPDGRPRIAFDLSHAGPSHSGTTLLARALVARAAARWTDLALHVVASAPAFAFHFAELGDAVTRVDPTAPTVFAALVRFGQPFLWGEVDAAVRRAPVLVLFMLDTIGARLRPRRAGRARRAVALHGRRGRRAALQQRLHGAPVRAPLRHPARARPALPALARPSPTIASAPCPMPRRTGAC